MTKTSISFLLPRSASFIYRSRRCTKILISEHTIEPRVNCHFRLSLRYCLKPRVCVYGCKPWIIDHLVFARVLLFRTHGTSFTTAERVRTSKIAVDCKTANRNCRVLFL
ncbi:hypothetical protein OIU78_020633 [Salix suchowensis]|nr:hypothetical protein OIU78_020633 [Salix suchowensis]